MDVDEAVDVEIPALLRAARGAYGIAVRERLAADYDDLPRNGPFVIGGMANHGGTVGDLVRSLGVTKQAASQLIDTLVLRGYLLRRPDEADGRRIVVELTEWGSGAATAVQAGVRAVDEVLERRLGADGVFALRAGLLALCDVRAELDTAAH